MKSLPLKEIESLLSKYNIPFCPTGLAISKQEAIKIANGFRYPVVLKASSFKGEHKTELGLVKKDIKNDSELAEAWDEIKKTKVKIEGILVQKQFSGIEIVVGMKRDRQFGPVLMFGIGGTLVEIMKDVTFRIAPIAKQDAIQMFKEIKGAKILAGYRGQQPVDLDKLSDLIVSLSKLAMDETNIKEIDFNPVIADKNGVWVVDPRFLLD
jgi:acetyl-CoA synthetase (ADP-forming)